MSESDLIKDSSLPYKEKLIAKGYVKLSQLPNEKEDKRWDKFVEKGVLTDPEVNELINVLFPKNDGNETSSIHIHGSSPCFVFSLSFLSTCTNTFFRWLGQAREKSLQFATSKKKAQGNVFTGRVDQRSVC